MKLLGLVVMAAACGPGLAPKTPAETHATLREVLLDASRDPAALTELFRGSITNGGLWFDDASCAGQFAAPRPLVGAELAAFGKCLAGLHLQPSAREDALGDVVVLTYGPGIEIEARVVEEAQGPHLSWIGYESRRAIDALVPTITAAALASIRTAGDANGPLDPADAARLQAELTPQLKRSLAWLRVCVDETGTVTLAHPYTFTTLAAREIFSKVAKSWQFKPYTIAGKVVPVCSMARLTFPVDIAFPETLPLPPPVSHDGQEALMFSVDAPPSVLEGMRIAGDKRIAPDDETKTRIASSNVRQIVGSFRICLDETGTPESVLPMRTTGYLAYDRKILLALNRWRYKPFLHDGKPTPVCTAITFIYSQR
jgi:hypothetical protein